MTRPNRHLPNQIVHLPRRTTQRQFLLKNDKAGITEDLESDGLARTRKHAEL